MGFQFREEKNVGFLILGLLLLVISACAKGVDPDKAVTEFLSTAPDPSSAAGSFDLSVAGGNGSAGNGGDGGPFTVNAAQLRMSKEGLVDASFTAPTATENLGANPRTITANTIIDLNDSIAGCPNPVTLLGGTDATANTTDATGLKVAAGAILTLVADPDCGGSVSFDILPGDIVIEGTLKTSGGDDISLSSGGSFLMRTGSAVDTSGAASATGNSESGGNLTVSVNGRVILQGTITTSGGSATTTAPTVGNGGLGGNVAIDSGYTFHNTGAIATAGGTAANGAGGNGGTITFRAGCAGNGGGLFNSGLVTASGGSGTTGAGLGGDIALNAVCSGASPGDLLNGASLTADGGSATAGDGETAGNITFTARGRLFNNGGLSANGGSFTGASPSTGNGGDGGTVTIMNNNVDDPNNETRIAAAITANGGNGVIGGTAQGGSINGGVNVHLLSFKEVHLHGGTGVGDGAGPNESGGDGGALTLNAIDDFLNELLIHIVGGDGTGTGTDGGDGGSVIIDANSVVNYGNITNSGGAGTDSGGNANNISINAADHGILNTASLSANGGSGSNAAAGSGGDGGAISLDASRSIANSGVLQAIGGDHPDSAGSGGGLTLTSTGRTANTAAITANGGNAATTAGTDGGFGGEITLATHEQPTANSGVLSVVKGTGSNTAVVNGTILIDGSNVIPTDGTLP